MRPINLDELIGALCQCMEFHTVLEPDRIHLESMAVDLISDRIVYGEYDDVIKYEYSCIGASQEIIDTVIKPRIETIVERTLEEAGIPTDVESGLYSLERQDTRTYVVERARDTRTFEQRMFDQLSKNHHALA